MMYHYPTLPITSDNAYPYATEYSECEHCTQPIERWLGDDDDLGLHWSKWGIRKGSTLDKVCG